MRDSLTSPEAVFAHALTLPEGEPRQTYLDQACAGRPDLRQEVVSLLQAHQKAGRFLEASGHENAPPHAASHLENPGDVIGPTGQRETGRYRLVRTLGEGGFGVVWLAEQEEPLRRQVALKIIKPGMDTREVIARFEAERQALALMDHPHIARVFDGGTTEKGRPYFVMELVPGTPITRFCDEHRLTTGARLKLFIQVCQAVQHAHQKGIIHRDLKPSNVLVAEIDGQPWPKVIDFGVAKAIATPLNERTMLTRFHQLMGTPAYMSPEQAGFGSLDVDTRSDVYSLGVLLYELLTGQTPFDTRQLLETGLEAVLRTIRELDPPKPSTRLSTLQQDEQLNLAVLRQTEPGRWRRLVEGDIDRIVMKALEKDRSRRYETPHALALDVLRHLQGEPVSAGAPGSLYRAKKFVRRNRVAVAAVALVVTVLLLSGTVSTWQWRKAERARLGESTQRQIAERTAHESRQRLIQISVANGVRADERGDGFGALLWFAEAMKQEEPGSPREKTHRLRLGSWMSYAPHLAQMWFHEGSVSSVHLSPDGQCLLTASADGTARIWREGHETAVQVLPLGTNVANAMFSADGRCVLAIGAFPGSPAQVWEASTGRPLGPPVAQPYRYTRIFLSRDGQHVFTLGDPTEPTEPMGARTRAASGELGIWNVERGAWSRAPWQTSHYVHDLALSPDGRWLAATWPACTVIWDLHERRVTQLRQGVADSCTWSEAPNSSARETDPLAGLPDPLEEKPSRSASLIPQPTCLAFSPDSHQLLVACSDGSMALHPLPAGPVRTFTFPPHGEQSEPRASWQAAVFSPDGNRVALRNSRDRVHVWDFRHAQWVGSTALSAADRPVWSPDSQLLFVGNRVWRPGSTSQETWSPIHFEASSGVFSADGARLITTGHDGTVRVWWLAAPASPVPPFLHETASTAARSNDDESPSINLREQVEAAMLESMQGFGLVEYSRDGKRLLTLSANGTACAWEADTGRKISPVVKLPGPLRAGAFSSDGKLFAAGGGYSNAGLGRVWRAEDGQPVSPVITYGESFDRFLFLPDAKQLVTFTSSGAQLWECASGQWLEWPLGRNRKVISLALSPDGNMIALSTVLSAEPSQASGRQNADLEPQLWLYDSKSWQPRGGPWPETNVVREITWSDDGRWLATVSVQPGRAWTRGLSRSDAVRLWDVAKAQPVGAAAGGFVQAIDFTRQPDRVFVRYLAMSPRVFDWERRCFLTDELWRGLRYGAPSAFWQGERVTDTREDGVRVMDALTGEPLTPWFPRGELDRANRVRFSPRGDVVVSSAMRAQCWPLPIARGPGLDLVRWAELLAARRMSHAGDVELLPVDEAKWAWLDGLAHGLGSRALSPAALRQWRESQIQAAEHSQLGSSAYFHLERMVAENPGDESLRLRRARLRDRLATDLLAPNTRKR